MLKSAPVNVNVDAMRKSIATVCLSGTLPDKLEAIAAARFDAVEIFENDLISFNGTPRDLASMTADLGLDIELYQPFRDFDFANRPHALQMGSRCHRARATASDVRPARHSA